MDNIPGLPRKGPKWYEKHIEGEPLPRQLANLHDAYYAHDKSMEYFVEQLNLLHMLQTDDPKPGKYTVDDFVYRCHEVLGRRKASDSFY